jgi:hypothetical protein
MGKESIYGRMEPYIRDNGNKIIFRDMESYHLLMENNIKEILSKIKQVGKVNSVI